MKEEAKNEAQEPCTKIVFFGDSITQGFCASRIDRTFPFLVGELLDYEVINLGIAGIGLNPGSAKVLGGIPMDRMVVEIGANDWKDVSVSRPLGDTFFHQQSQDACRRAVPHWPIYSRVRRFRRQRNNSETS